MKSLGHILQKNYSYSLLNDINRIELGKFHFKICSLNKIIFFSVTYIEKINKSKKDFVFLCSKLPTFSLKRYRIIKYYKTDLFLKNVIYSLFPLPQDKICFNKIKMAILIGIQELNAKYRTSFLPTQKDSKYSYLTLINLSSSDQFLSTFWPHLNNGTYLKRQ